jgi:autotransporter-associated beta strand protein
VATGAGTLRLLGDVTTLPASRDNTISGNLSLNATRTFNISLASDLYVSATIQGLNPGDGLIKAGAGNLHLLAANFYSGLTMVQGGWLWVSNSLALGTTASGTIVSNGASLMLHASIGITNEALTLNGAGVSAGYGALHAEAAGTNVWAGPITLNGNATIAPYGSATVLRLNSPIAGPGGLTMFTSAAGTGILYLDGGTANTYAGTTTVHSGLLAQQRLRRCHPRKSRRRRRRWRPECRRGAVLVQRSNQSCVRRAGEQQRPPASGLGYLHH